MTWLVIFEHPDPREVDDQGDRHQRRIEVDVKSRAPGHAGRPGREHAIHLGWRQNARIAIDQGRPLYDFASAAELDGDGQPVPEPAPPRRSWRLFR